MKGWINSKKLMTAVCLMFAAILSLCSINVLNYTNLNTTNVEEVADDASNEDLDFNSDITSDENLSEEEDTETSDNTSEEGSQSDENETNGDDGDIVPPENADNTENTTDTSEEDDLDDVATAATEISTASQLRSMGSTGSYTLTANITLTGTWTPKDFSGTFNGNGYTISGINVTSSMTAYAGFFGYLSGNVSNVIFSGTVSVSQSHVLYVGGVAGYLSGSISNVWSQINVTGNNANSVGGIVGYDDGSISNCLNDGRVSGSRANAGGIAGATYGDNIYYCINKGSVNGNNAGGILGFCSQDVQISSCVNLGSVTGGSCAGGIVGKLGSVTWPLNFPLASIINCVNTGSIGGQNAGIIGGDVDAGISNCHYRGSGSICGKENNSDIGGNVTYCSSLGNAMTTTFGSVSYSSNSIFGTFTGVFGSVYFSTFARQINIYVAVENENGGYTTVSNNSYLYNVGFRSGATGSGNTYYMLASSSTSTIVSSIINNSNDAYEYVGIYGSLSGNDLISSENTYREHYNEAPSAIYVRFDLKPTEITANVYYSTRFSSSGNVPSSVSSGTTGGSATISTSSSNTTVQIGTSATVETEKGDTITITTFANSGYELVGLFMGSIGSCVNILQGNRSNVSVSYNDSLSQITYTFTNTNITSGGEMVDEYLVVFARYQFTNISVSESYTTDREEFVDEFGATTRYTTYLTYGFASRSLHYVRNRTGSASFYYSGSNQSVSTITLIAGSSSNPFFAGNRAWYVASCGTSFYWGGEDVHSFNFQNTTTGVLNNYGISAYNSTNPYFVVNLYTYFTRLYGTSNGYINVSNGSSASFSFKEYSVNLDEKRGGETRSYDVYIVDGYEDIQTGVYTYGEVGGKTNLIRNGRFVSKTDVMLDNGVIGETGASAEGYELTDFVVNYYYDFVYNSYSPFSSYFYNEDYGDDYLDRSDKVSETALNTLDQVYSSITKTIYTGYYDESDNDYMFTSDYNSSNFIDVRDYTVLELTEYMRDLSSSDLGRQNIDNNNIVLYSKFSVTSFDLTVKLDQNYLIYQTGSPFRLFVNGELQTMQSHSTDKYVISGIRAYSEIEIVIDDEYFLFPTGVNYRFMYTYNNITLNGVEVSDKSDSYRFQIIPEENGASLTYTVNYDEALFFGSMDANESNITIVGNTWYIDDYTDFYYLYYLNYYMGETFENIRLVQTKNIDFGGNSAVPLGSDKTAFKGYYDGQYYTISNFNINIGNTSNAGFFGYVEDAEIKNVALLNGSVTGFSNVGGVVGYANNSTLTRLGNYNVSVTSLNKTDNNNIFVYTTGGELVALNENNIGTNVGQYNVIVDALIRDENGNIYYTSSENAENLGGFAGYLSSSTVSTCFSRGVINGSATGNGGFVGNAVGGSISNCYTTLSTFGNTSGSSTFHIHATDGRDIDDVCSTCEDMFIW